MNAKDVKCPICGTVNRSLDLDETDGWMECEHCHNAVQILEYANLLTAGTLDGHLADIEEQAQELFLRLVKQYADTEGVTEEVKANDPQAWVRKMNGIRHRANEVVMQEIVYG